MCAWRRVAAILSLTAVPGSAQTIPPCPGLTLAGVVSETEGDYEPLVTVGAIDSAGVHLGFSTQVRPAAGDRFNLELSQRRAAAVKQSLVTGYGITPARLSTAGFGEARPKVRNDTEEGRVRNRRVELLRLP